MSFNSEKPRVEYIATAGQTVFTFLFKVYKDSDIKVYSTAEGDTPDDATDILVLGVDYTVVIDGDAGGYITLNTGSVLNDSVTLIRQLPQDRDIEYQTNGDLLATTLNDDQDYQTYLIADSSANNERYLKLPINAQNINPVLPAPVSDSYLLWNSEGTQLTNDTTIPQNVVDAKESADKAKVSETNAAASETASQLSAWESEAEKMTSDSYATEDAYVAVKIYSSNGNGTFSFTSTNPAEYSSLHWANISSGGGVPEAPEDAKTYGRKDATWVDIGTPVPLVEVNGGSPTATENTDVDVLITDFNANYFYQATVNGGTIGSLIVDKFIWTLPSVDADTDYSVEVRATEVGSVISLPQITTITVLYIVVTPDQTLLYEGASMANFTDLTNTSIVADEIVATAIDTTNIIATASADSFDTAFKVYDGNIVNVDGVDMVASGVTEVTGTYTVPTTPVTAGATPATAYVNMHRAIVGTPIDQDAGETDFAGLDSQSVQFEANYEFTDISEGSTTDVLNTTTPIANGDNLVVVKDDDSINPVVASGVTESGGVYSMPYTGMSQTSKAYAVDAEPKFLIGDGVFESAVKSSVQNSPEYVAGGKGGDGADNPSTISAVPILTSNTANSNFIASASTEYDSQLAFKAFNGTANSDANDKWYSYSGKVPEWLKISMTTAAVFNKLEMWGDSDAGYDYNPHAFIIKGSNDDTNWVSLSATLNGDGINSTTSTTFTWFNDVEYKHYMIDVSESTAAGQYIVISQLDFIEAQESSNIITTRAYDQLITQTSGTTLQTQVELKSVDDKCSKVQATVLKVS